MKRVQYSDDLLEKGFHGVEFCEIRLTQARRPARGISVGNFSWPVPTPPHVPFLSVVYHHFYNAAHKWNTEVMLYHTDCLYDQFTDSKRDLMRLTLPRRYSSQNLHPVCCQLLSWHSGRTGGCQKVQSGGGNTKGFTPKGDTELISLQVLERHVSRSGTTGPYANRWWSHQISATT